jgi:hypothetical protein
MGYPFWAHVEAPRAQRGRGVSVQTIPPAFET